MSRIAYVNGRYLPQPEAAVNVEDRGYQFGDGIYEVVHLYEGRYVDEDRHLARLERSLKEIRLPMPMSRAALSMVLREVARRNRVTEGLLYMQVTRGVARRDHPFPAKPVPPALVVTVKRIPPYPTGHRALGFLLHHAARPPLGAAGHQEREPAAQRAGPPGGARTGRDRGDPLRRGDRPRHRRRGDHLLDRGRGRARSARGTSTTSSCRLHPGRADGRAAGRGHRLRRAGIHARRDAPRAGGLHHLRHLLRPAHREDRRRAGRRREGGAGGAAPLRHLRAPREGPGRNAA
jgi:hypothetical protein